MRKIGNSMLKRDEMLDNFEWMCQQYVKESETTEELHSKIRAKYKNTCQALKVVRDLGGLTEDSYQVLTSSLFDISLDYCKY